MSVCNGIEENFHWEESGLFWFEELTHINLLDRVVSSSVCVYECRFNFFVLVYVDVLFNY